VEGGRHQEVLAFILEKLREAMLAQEDQLRTFIENKVREQGGRLVGWALGAAVARLERDFGRWRLAWGEVNRYQRLTGDIVQPFDDLKPSLRVGFAPGQWGALASFDSTKPRATKRIYGSEGNSFIAAVEFGPTVRAKALMAGGESGDPGHFRIVRRQ